MGPNKSVMLVALVALVLTVATTFSKTQLSDKVKESLKKNGRINAIVWCNKTVHTEALNKCRLENLDRDAKINMIYNELYSACEKDQTEVIATFGKHKKDKIMKCTCYWISNCCHMEAATEAVLEDMAKIYNVEDISEEEHAYLHDASVDAAQVESALAAGDCTSPWGVCKIGAWTVWPNCNGTNVRVANIDTGVRWTHEALKGNYLGTYGWFDACGNSTTPYDNHGHGTHTMGTICGGGPYKIGVAPGAKWMACKGCPGSSCPQSCLLACAQWILCPDNRKGSKNCTLAPHVVSNSWGSVSVGWFNSAIATWRAAGIIPIFSAGNNYPNCTRSTLGYPGSEYTVLTASSMDIDGHIAGDTSCGTPNAPLNETKPNVILPGVNVLSSLNGNDADYAYWSGTSMAAPHLAGLIALLKCKKLLVTFDTLRMIIQNTAYLINFLNDGSCEGIPANTVPNSCCGYGQCNASAAYNQV